MTNQKLEKLEMHFQVEETCYSMLEFLFIFLFYFILPIFFDLISFLFLG